MKFNRLELSGHAIDRWKDRVLSNADLMLDGAWPSELLPHMRVVRPDSGTYWTRLMQPHHCYADFEGLVLFVMEPKGKGWFKLLTVYTRRCLDYASERNAYQFAY